jgi:hypothetical protein
VQTLLDGKIEITAADFPSFLYESGTVYNPDDEVTGLFRGFLLVRVCTSFLLWTLLIVISGFSPHIYWTKVGIETRARWTKQEQGSNFPAEGRNTTDDCLCMRTSK